MARRVAGIKIDIESNSARLSADITRAVGILTGFERQVKGLSNSWKGLIGGLSFAGAAYGLKKFSDSVLALAEAGDAAGDIQNAFFKLGGSSEGLAAASDRTQGLIEKFDLMRAANDALVKGIPDLNKHFADFADLATRVATAKGLDPTETLGALIAAVSGGKAKALREFGIEIDGVKGRAAGMAAAIDGVKASLNNFDPVTLGAADSFQVFKNTMSDVEKEIGMAVDNSAVLAGELLKLKIAADDGAFKQLGESLASIEAVFISIASKAIPLAIREVEKFALGLDYLFALTEKGTFARGLEIQQSKTAQIQNELEQVGKYQPITLSIFRPKSIVPPEITAEEDKKQFLQDRLNQSLAIEEQLKKDYFGKQQQSDEELLAQREKAAEEYSRRTAELLKNYTIDVEQDSGSPRSRGRSQNQAGVQEARLTMRDLAAEADQFRLAIEDAIQRVDPAAFSEFRAALYRNTEQAFLAANQTLVKEGLRTQEELGAMARAEAEKTVGQYDDQMRDAIGRQSEQMRQAHEQAAQQWSGLLDNIFNPQETSWQDSLKQLAQGFASEILAGLLGGLNSDLGSFQGVGKVIGRAILEALKGGGNESGAGWGDNTTSGQKPETNFLNQVGNYLKNLFGGQQNTLANEQMNPGSTGISTDQAHQGGIQGPGGADGSFNSGSAAATDYAGFIAAAMQVFGDSLAAKERDRQSQSNAGTGMAVGGGIGGIIGGIFGGVGGAQIGAAIGSAAGGFIGSLFKWGAQNPETNARKAFSDFIEEGFEKLKTVSFFDAQGKVRTFNAQNIDFSPGDSTRFNPGGDKGGVDWTENFKAMGDEVVGFFSGLGEAFEEVLGLTDDVGSQLGYILAENLGGNIDNARLLVVQLGLDMDKMIEKLMEAGRTGEMSWLEVFSAINSVNQAFEKGLVAVGDVSGAWEEFIGSGGRGMAALKGLKDMAHEAIEAGGSSLEDLRAKLIAAGANPEAVDALINAIRSKGIKTLKELEEANDNTLGSIVADTNANSEVLTEKWEKMKGTLEDMKETLDTLPDKMEKSLTIKVKTEFDENTEKAMDKNIYKDTEAEKLESAPMADTSSSSTRYRRSVPSDGGAKASSMVVNIDARGATKGVHNDVTTAMAVMENRIVTRTANIIYEQMQRGGL